MSEQERKRGKKAGKIEKASKKASAGKSGKPASKKASAGKSGKPASKKASAGKSGKPASKSARSAKSGKKSGKSATPAKSGTKTNGVAKGKAPRSGAGASAPTPAELVAQAHAQAFTDQSPQAAFEHFRPLAEAVVVEESLRFTGQPLVMRANVLAALEALAPHLEQVVTALREPRLHEVLELPALVMALDFAAGRVPVAKLSTGEIEAMLSEGAPWRRLMLRYLEVAADPLLGLLPRERVAAVRAGSGKLDMAQDFVALTGMFSEFGESLSGQHPFPSAAIERLGELGTALVQSIRPGRAATPRAQRTEEALLRDRFAVLVAERYDHLGTLVTVALGKRQADAVLPALQSMVTGGRAGNGEGAEEVAEEVADDTDGELAPMLA